MAKKKVKTTKVKKNKTAAPVKAKEPTGEMAQKEPRSPFTMMRQFAENMENIFSDFDMMRGFPTTSLIETDLSRTEQEKLFEGFSPAVEMLESDGRLIVRADLPGMKKDDIKVEIRDNLLTIEGERKQESKEEREGYFRSERSYGNFYRCLRLPETAKSEDAKATFKDGVLEVNLAAPQLTEKGKRLEITEESTDSKKAAVGK